MKKLFVFLLFFSLLVFPFVHAAGFDIIIEEDGGKLTSFYDEYYIARVNGTVTISNPSSSSFFNINIPFYLSTYTLRSPNNTNQRFIDESGIFILEIPPNSNVSFEYEIGGISTEDFTQNGKAMLETALDNYDFKIYSNVMGSVLKAPIEDASLTGRNTTRLISAHLSNPTGFDFTVDLVNVIKTSDLDPSNQLNSWDFTSNISNLEPYQTIEFDFFDDDAHEGEVYWLQTDIYLDEITLTVSRDIDFLDQDDLFLPVSNETNVTYNETATEFFDKRVFIRKLVSSTLALPGESINITLVVNNFGSTSLQGILTDTIPYGFELEQVYAAGSSINGDSLEWVIDINPRTAQRFVYQLKFVDEDSIGVDYFDAATIEYEDEFVYSQSVPFVRQYIAQKKVYVQKSLDFRANGDVQVDIAVRNLGEVSLSNLIVKEFLGPGDEFKEITKPFREKGVWHIEELGAGQIWETSYVTDRSNVLNSFPELFGVPRSGLFRNIILKNVVESKFKILQTSTVEIIGLSLLALVILMYVIPHSVLLSVKKKYLKELRSTDKELKQLKQSTARKVDVHPQQQVAPSSPSSNATPSQQAMPEREKPAYLKEREEKIAHTQSILDDIKKKLDEK